MKEHKSYFIGLDLSYSGTGVVVLEDENSKPTHAFEFKAGKPDYPFTDRINDLWKQVKRCIPEIDVDTNITIAIEGASYGSEFNAFMLGELNGAIKYILKSAGYNYILVPPTLLKKFATGSGNAQKTFVAAHVAKKWDFMHASNNVTDAYVLAKIAQTGLANVEELLSSKKKKRG